VQLRCARRAARAPLSCARAAAHHCAARPAARTRARARPFARAASICCTLRPNNSPALRAAWRALVCSAAAWRSAPPWTARRGCRRSRSGCAWARRARRGSRRARSLRTCASAPRWTRCPRCAGAWRFLHCSAVTRAGAPAWPSHARHAGCTLTERCGFSPGAAARSCLTDDTPAVVDEAAAHLEELLTSGACCRALLTQRVRVRVRVRTQAADERWVRVAQPLCVHPSARAWQGALALTV
jgi:hypothetical protein